MSRSSAFLFVLLASSLATAHAALEQGIYRISNVESTTTIRSNVVGAPIYVTDANEAPGLNELWLAKRIPRSPDGFFSLENLGLSAYASINNATGDLVATSPTEQGFFIQDASESGTYTIAVPGLQSAWNVEDPLTHGFVKLRDATGTARQQWRFVSAIN